MNLAVDQPILNNPFAEPTRYWIYQSGQPYPQNGRRPDEQTTLFTDEQFVELTHINQIRHQVKQWREGGYQGVTPSRGSCWSTGITPTASGGCSSVSVRQWKLSSIWWKCGRDG